MDKEEKKEKWLNYLAVSTVIIAVCATLSTFKGGGYSTRSLLSQSKAANQWSFFQSKSIKQYLYEIQKENIEMDIARSIENNPRADVAIYKKKLASYDEKIKKYEKEKEEIMKTAKEFEVVRDEAKQHSQQFGLAVIFLQVAILLSSIAALMKKKLVWYCSLVGGVFGILYFVDGFFLFIK